MKPRVAFDGKNYVVHPNKGGYVYVYNRDVSSVPLKIENVWQLGKTANFVKGVDPKTGELIDLARIYAAASAVTRVADAR